MGFGYFAKVTEDIYEGLESGKFEGYTEGLEKIGKKYGEVEFDYINAYVPMFKDVEVELHWRVQSMTNLFRNLRLQRWLEREETKEMIFGGKADMKPSESLQSSLL